MITEVKPEEIVQKLNEAVERFFKEAADHEFNLAKERLEARRDEIVASALIYMRRHFEMNTMHDVVTFRVEINNKK